MRRAAPAAIVLLAGWSLFLLAGGAYRLADGSAPGRTGVGLAADVIMLGILGAAGLWLRRVLAPRAVELGLLLGRVNHVELVRYLAHRYRARSFLEIGVKDGYTMFRVPARRKVGVDPTANVGWRARLRYARVSPWNLFCRVHRQTSDAFFAGPAARLFGRGGVDVVFVDGKHTHEQALRDIRSALALLSPRGIVVAHDTNPESAAEAFPADSPAAAAALEPPGWTGRWCGDVWKAIVELRRDAPGLGVATLPADFGMTVINPRIDGRPLDPPVEGDLADLAYEDFAERRADWLSLVDVRGLTTWLGRDPQLPPERP